MFAYYSSPSRIVTAIGVTLLSGLALGACSSQTEIAPPADLVLKNASIYTVDSSQPVASALAIDDGRFVAVGSAEKIEAYIGDETQVRDLGGAFIMPGMQDAHIHAQMAAEFENGVIFDPDSGWDAIVDAILRADAETPGNGWLFGGNLPWLSDIVGEREDLPAVSATLDAIVSDRPAAFWDVGGHAILANTAAMRAAGIDAETPDPEGGTIERDAEGEPTGVLRELATNLITETMPVMSDERYATGLSAAFDQLNALGITSVGEVWVYPHTVRSLELLDDREELDMRVVSAIAHPVEFVDPELKARALDMIESRTEYEGRRFKIRYTKFVLDGSAGGQTLALTQPYIGTDFRGKLRNPEDVVLSEVSRLHADGLGSVIHGVGDRAIRIGLDAVEAALTEHGDNGVRHTLAHTVFVNPEDLDRFAELNIVAEFSPYFWMPSEGLELIRFELGEERLQWGWPARALLDRGVTLSVGSDWPVVMDPNPFPAMESLVTRRKPGDVNGDAYGPQHAITVEEAIEMFTMGSAYGLYQETETGSITVGKFADFIVLDQDLTVIDVYDIHRTRVLETFLEGEQIFESEKN